MTCSIESVKVVIFDCDNTLINTNKFVRKCIKLTCSALDHQYEKTLVIEKQNKNLPFQNLIFEIFQGKGELAFTTYRSIADRPDLSYTECSGAGDVVSFFREKNITQMILTNRANKISQRLREAKIDDATFKKIITPQETKPSVQAYDEVKLILDEDQLDKSSVISIGDHLHDYESASKNDIAFFAVLTGTSTKEEFIYRGLPENYIFNDMKALLEFFKSKNDYRSMQMSSELICAACKTTIF